MDEFERSWNLTQYLVQFFLTQYLDCIDSAFSLVAISIKPGFYSGLFLFSSALTTDLTAFLALFATDISLSITFKYGLTFSINRKLYPSSTINTFSCDKQHFYFSIDNM